MLFRCDKGHEWLAMSSTIIRGGWCYFCAGRGNKLQEAIEFAKKYEGQCLSKDFDYHEKLKWKCKNGHEWDERLVDLKSSKRFCSYCLGHKTHEDEVKRIAKKRGGIYLGLARGCRSKFRLQCKRGHCFSMRGCYLIGNCWCPQCKKQDSWNISKIRMLAKEHEGKCLSKKYLGYKKRHQFQCKKGHTWNAFVGEIAKWCPYCAGRRITLENLRDLARAHGGKCLSDKYTWSGASYKWECEFGHIWTSKYDNIYRGCWCPTCAKQKFAIMDLKNLAQFKGGQYLGDTPAHINKSVHWLCACGHEWKATFTEASKNWCPRCSERKYPIAQTA